MTEQRSAKLAMSSLAGTSLLAAGVAFLSNILTARALGPEFRGHIAFILQASYFLAPIVIIASDRAVLRRGRNEGQFFVVKRRQMLIIGILLAAVLLVSYRDGRALAAPAAMVAGWYLLRRSEVASKGGYARYIRPFVAFQFFVIITHITLFLLGVRAWEWWAAAYATPLVALVFMPAISQRSGTQNRPITNFPLLLGSLSQIWSLRGERLIMPALAGPTALGLYIVVATATEPLYWAAQALADHRVGSIPPRGTRNRLRALGASTTIFAAAAIAVWLALEFLMVPIFGPKFEAAKPLILPLVLASVALAAYRLATGWVLAGPRPTAVGPLELKVAMVALVAYPIGILHAEALGAAWATLLVYCSAVGIALIPAAHNPPTH